METTGTDRDLRVLRPGDPQEADESAPDLSTLDYWARVQALREDLAALRPAN